MKLDVVKEYEAFQYEDGVFTKLIVPVSTEYGITVAINNKPFVTIASSGDNLQEMVIGFLVAEGIVREKEEIEAIEFDNKTLTVNVTLAETDNVVQRMFSIRSIISGCGGYNKLEITQKLQPCTVDPEIIIKIGKQFYQTSDLNKQTHGVHSAGLYDTSGTQLAFYDEIGRHSAIDKLVGYALLQDIPLDNTFVFSTGRISSEIVYKAIASGFSVVATKGSPTSLAIELANTYNVILIAKLRIHRFCVFNTNINIESIFGVGVA
ncbi:MAG: formate dehydrogenase accessory sulfurtransferase FdhD [Spirochaetota bacterium]